MTNIFIESGDPRKNNPRAVNTNEYIFIKTIVELCTSRKDKVDYSIVYVGGKDNLQSVSPKFFDHKSDDEKNLVIFDADMPETGGGFEKRKKELIAALNNMNVQYELFLFPNNKDDGTFEHLLEKLINSQHNCILKCFEYYEKCLEKYTESDGSFSYQTPDQKAKMYAYISSFKRSNAQNQQVKNKGLWDFENKEYWELDSKELEPLKKFLIKNI